MNGHHTLRAALLSLLLISPAAAEMPADLAPLQPPGDPFPPPVADECRIEPFVIPFRDGSADLSPDALRQVADIFDQYVNAHTPVLIQAHRQADEARDLNRRRADAIIRLLGDRGVPARNIWVRHGTQPGARVVIEVPTASVSCAYRRRHPRLEWVRRHCFPPGDRTALCRWAIGVAREY